MRCAGEEEGKSNTLGRLWRVDVFFPPCLFPAGGGAVGGRGLDGRVIPLAVARLLLLCVGAAAICPADAD